MAVVDEGDSEPITAEEYEEVVEQLASEFDPPFKDRYVLRLPKELGTSKLATRQQPIAEAYKKLSDNIEVALPVLLAHTDDERFSHVYEDGPSGTFNCRSVGSTCAMIIGHHVGVYSSAVTRRHPDGRFKRFSDDKPEKDFWKKRQGWSLEELQLDRIDWALRKKKPSYFSEAEWQEAKAKLHEMARQIRDLKKPILVKDRIQFFSK